MWVRQVFAPSYDIYCVYIFLTPLFPHLLCTSVPPLSFCPLQYSIPCVWNHSSAASFLHVWHHNWLFSCPALWKGHLLHQWPTTAGRLSQCLSGTQRTVGSGILLSPAACWRQKHAEMCSLIWISSFWNYVYRPNCAHVCVGGDVAESELPASRGSWQSWCHFWFTKRRGTVVHQHGQQWTGTNTHNISYVFSYNLNSESLVVWGYTFVCTIFQPTLTLHWHKELLDLYGSKNKHIKSL